MLWHHVGVAAPQEQPSLQPDSAMPPHPVLTLVHVPQPGEAGGTPGVPPGVVVTAGLEQSQGVVVVLDVQTAGEIAKEVQPVYLHWPSSHPQNNGGEHRQFPAAVVVVLVVTTDFSIVMGHRHVVVVDDVVEPSPAVVVVLVLVLVVLSEQPIS